MLFDVGREPAQRQRTGAGTTKELAASRIPVFAATDRRFVSGDDAGGTVAEPLCPGGRGAPRTATRHRRRSDALSPQPVAPDSRLVVTGFGANREQVLTAPLSDYRIVHFATHGLVHSRYPGSSALAFPQFDAAGQPLHGLLRLQDVYRLDLNADFVVLERLRNGARKGDPRRRPHRARRRISVCRSTHPS